MDDLEFFDEIPINVASALHQLLGRFQAVKDGLPELVKNSKDQYVRLAITERDERVIVVLIDTERRSVGVLDFGGATREDFRYWVKWADPNAYRGALKPDIEGGHGNGGKGFMVRGSKEGSSFESCREGRRTKMGYSATVEDRLYFPAIYTEGGRKVDNVAAANVREHLNAALEGLAAKFDGLPALARDVFAKRQAFSLVHVNAVRDWSGRRPSALQLMNATADDLVIHPQAALSIETCSVFVVIDGAPIPNGPLVRSVPAPMPGFETETVIQVPAELEDPRTGDMIRAWAADAASTEAKLHVLKLSTSKQSLRMTGGKAVNVVRVRNARNVIDNWSVADLCAQPASAHIYGVVEMPTMGTEHQVGADRSALADTPLVRALHAWTAQQVTELANRIQKAISKEHKPQEVDKANDSLRKMREAMREFLERTAQGQGGGGVVPPPPPPPGTIVRQILLERGAQSIALAKGTTVPLSVQAYDLSPTGERLPVRGAQLELASDPSGLTSLVGRRILRADAVGRSVVWFRDTVTNVESNRVEVEIVEAVGAEIQDLPARPLLQGESVPLRFLFKTSRRTKTDAILEARLDLTVDAGVDELNMGWVDRYGVFTAGGQEGAATVRVRFGAGPADTAIATVHVGPDRVPDRYKRPRGNQGPDIPHILLCGAEAPNREHYPEDQRTLKPSEFQPTIIDYEPHWTDVIFINQDSKEAAHVREGRGGRRGAAGIGSETFLQFLAIKCFEILKRLYVRQVFKDGAQSELQFREAFADAELRCAGFVDQAFEIAQTLTAGRDRE